MTFVTTHRDLFGVEPILRVLKVPTSTFYDWVAQQRDPSRRRRQDAWLLAKIRAVHRRSGGTYGAPRVHAQLRRDGVQVSRKRVARLMGAHAVAILGYPVRQWIDEPDFWRSHTHPGDVQWCTEFCQDSVRSGRDHQFEYRMIAADGRSVWLRDIVTVVVEGGEAVARVEDSGVGIPHDMLPPAGERFARDFGGSKLQASPSSRCSTWRLRGYRASGPGKCGSTSRCSSAVPVFRGSMTISLAPRAFARLILAAAAGHVA